MKKFILLLFVSLCLFAESDRNKWKTVFEESDYTATSNYEETVEFYSNLAGHSQFAKLVSLGKSPQQRDIFALIVSRDRTFSRAEVGSLNKPVILVNNGIHAGEIEGKDACALLLREMLVTKEKEELLDEVILIVIPILNVDGHERKSPFNRINQNGPAEMGWRTTSQNLNLNRDFTKADAPEMKFLLNLYSDWLPDIFIDTHTTNGLDYQYTLTYGIERHKNTRKVLREWTINEFIPYFEKGITESGYEVAPYFAYKNDDPRFGIFDWVSGPRFSHGYAPTHNRVGLLLETHMLKPYKDRVFVTKAAVETVLRYANENPGLIVNNSKKADSEAIQIYFEKRAGLAIDFKLEKEEDKFLFKGYEPYKYYSEIAGDTILTYSKKPMNLEIAYQNNTTVTDSLTAPFGYLVPVEWNEIIEIIKLHGIELEEVNSPHKFLVEKIIFGEPEFADFPYESRFRVNAEYKIEEENLNIETGYYFVSANQPAIPLILHLLEPKGSDSFFQWGFFNQIFERKEYFEFYSMEPLAKRIYNENKILKEKFENRLKEDEEFRKSPRARLNFFYENSKYFDKKYRVYPVLRVINEL